MNTPKFQFKLIVGEGNFLIPLSHDATSVAENKVALTRNKLLGLQKFWKFSKGDPWEIFARLKT